MLYCLLRLDVGIPNAKFQPREYKKSQSKNCSVFGIHQPMIITNLKFIHWGDPLGPLFFSLVLQKITMAIYANDDCLALHFNAWYLDDGVLAGRKSAILCALSLIDTLGQSLGLHIKLAKVQAFQQK